MAPIDKIVAIVIALLLTLQSVKPAKILMLPMTLAGSHVNFFSLLGNELMSRGHDVTVVANEQNSFVAAAAGVKVIQHNISTEAEKTTLKEHAQFKKEVEEKSLTPLILFKHMASTMAEVAEFMFQDKELMSQIEKGMFELAIVDGLDFARPMYLIPYRFNIRFITLTARHDPWMAGVPALPSVEPFFANAVVPADLQSFVQRAFNTIMFLASYYHLNSLFDNSLISKWAPNKPTTTFSELIQSSELFIANVDPVCLEPPVASAPNYIFVHGLAISPPKPLPDDLKTFIESSGDEGVILVSFGSVMQQMLESTQLAFSNAFRQIPQKVIMKQSGRLSDRALSSNVLIQKWIPQNDLLGHPKVKLFITHGGSNGQQEAVYHGVPMITMPISGDQFHNARRAENRGYGKTVDMRTFTSEDLLLVIREILGDPKYAERIKRCSSALHSLEHPRKVAARWIEHVLEHGGDHLRPPGLGVPLYQWFMVDIIAAFIISLISLCILLLSLCRCIFRKCIRGSSKGHPEQKIAKKASKHAKKE